MVSFAAGTYTYRGRLDRLMTGFFDVGGGVVSVRQQRSQNKPATVGRFSHFRARLSIIFDSVVGRVKIGWGRRRLTSLSYEQSVNNIQDSILLIVIRRFHSYTSILQTIRESIQKMMNKLQKKQLKQ